MRDERKGGEEKKRRREEVRGEKKGRFGEGKNVYRKGFEGKKVKGNGMKEITGVREG